ncbi:MAG: hypothetical protein IPP60_00225 [Sphingobacteriales bacterium]|nr:hypothetical protein [Sphingobacteriales bacterium]
MQASKQMVNNFTLTVLKWSFQPITSSFDQVEEFLGFDNEGYDRMQQNRNHLTELLGNPSHIKLEKINNCEVGEIIWENKIGENFLNWI